ncbi:hypothetical protein [Pseudolactococcus hodotermopsidis]|nr:hypothetical protein [Lactococcus hodotermopsidis]
MKLPRNGKEFALFLAIVSILSVNIIAPLITCFEIGFSLQTWKNTLAILPFIWVAVVIFVLLTNAPASKLAKKIVHEKDSFNSQITVNILVNVLMMSILLTVVATWIGTKSFTLEPVQNFFYRWPRNFAISLFVEMIIAQPIARFVLHKMHIKLDAKA